MLPVTLESLVPREPAAGVVAGWGKLKVVLAGMLWGVDEMLLDVVVYVWEEVGFI